MITRRLAWAAGLLLALGWLWCAASAQAVIMRLTPLKEVLTHQPIICLAKVTSVLPDKPAMVLQVDEHLKGKAPFEKMAIVLKGDADAEKDKHAEVMLKRVAEGVPVLVFANKRGKMFETMCYTNGTWFSLLGQADADDPTKVSWRFLHCEPYLRRTYTGATAELKQIIVDGLAGKKEPPAPNEKEPPGFGPELKKDNAPKKSGLRPGGSRRFAEASTPTFAVIPTVAIGGPLAILSMLFPTLFGKPKEVFARYTALLTVASINSLLYLGYFLVQTYWPNAIAGTWWGSEMALWICMAVVTLLGTVWAFRRHRAAVASGEAEKRIPAKGEMVVYQILSLIGVACVGYALGAHQLFDPPWKEMNLMWAVVWTATAGVLYLQWLLSKAPDSKPVVALEGMMMVAMTLATIGMIFTFTRSSYAVELPPVAVDAADEFSPKFEKGAIVFKAEEPGTLDSTPLVTADRIYAAVAHRSGFSAYGRLYCIDRASGKVLWKFDSDDEMKQVFCSPTLADGKIFIGEGYHQDSLCKLYCLDANDGKKLWDFKTKSHTESTPAVADGKVYFGAGDDGLYCLDAKDGKELWHFEGLHIDTSPTVVGNRLYGGSGYGDQYWLFCLDTATGKPIWRQTSKLPVFGSPTVLGQQVFFGTGNGNMIQSDPSKPAGALLCYKTDGTFLWSYATPDGIHTKPAVDRRHVYFGARDGSVYAVRRSDGQLAWKEDLGSPVVTAPALLTSDSGDSYSLYTIGVGGRVCCLDPLTGKHLYEPFDVAKASSTAPQLLSSPRVLATRRDDGEARQVYFGAGLSDKGTWQAALYCVEDRFPLPAISASGAVVRNTK